MPVLLCLLVPVLALLRLSVLALLRLSVPAQAQHTLRGSPRPTGEQGLPSVWEMERGGRPAWTPGPPLQRCRRLGLAWFCSTWSQPVAASGQAGAGPYPDARL